MEALLFICLVGVPIVEDVALADYLEVGDHAASLKTGDRDHPDLVDLLHDSFVSDRPLSVWILALALQEMLKVVDVADLRRDCHALPVSSPDVSVVKQRFICCAAVAGVDEVAADHDASPALARLAVDGGDVLAVPRQVAVQVFAELVHVDKGRRVVVVELEAVVLRLERLRLVDALRA